MPQEPGFPPNSQPECEAANRSMWCSECGYQVSARDIFCNNCGNQLLPLADDDHGTTRPARNWKKLSLIAGAAVLLLLIIGISTRWFGLKGPAVSIARAVKNTMNKGSFSYDLNYKMKISREDYWGDPYESESQFRITGYLSVDVKKKELILYGKIKSRTDPNTSGELAIYDEYFIYCPDEGECYRLYIGNYLDTIFEVMESTSGNLNPEKLLDELPEELVEKLEDVINTKTMKKTLLSYFRKLNNPKWLEEYAGYSVEKVDGVTVHSFSPGLHKFLKASLETLEPLFADDDIYDDLKDSLNDEKDIMNDCDLDFSFGIKRNKLVSFSIETESDSDYTEGDSDYDERVCAEIEIEFSDIGKVKVDIDELEDMLDAADCGSRESPPVPMAAPVAHAP